LRESKLVILLVYETLCDMKLDQAFYERNEVEKIARELIGKQLFTKTKGRGHDC